MSVFSLMRKGRQQAKEHTAKESEKADEQQQQQQPKTPYKHVPTHACADALAGAPPSWQHDYRSKIKEQNHKRRLSMASERYTTSNLPRVSSSLSFVSYPSAHASPVVPISKVQSFNSLPPSWQHRSPLGYPREDNFTQPAGWKGKEREVIPPVPPLPAGAHLMSGSKSINGASRSQNSGNSSSSDEELEIRSHARSVSFGGQYLHPAHQRQSSGQSARSYSSQSRNHRFKAPQPINHDALGFTPSASPSPEPPIGASDSASSSPAASNPVSYASSARSGDSTAPSSAASTPPASIIAAFPTVDKMPPLTREMSWKSTVSKDIKLSKVGTISSKSGYGAAAEVNSAAAGDKAKRRQTVSDVKTLEVKKRRWTFFSSKRPVATAA